MTSFLTIKRAIVFWMRTTWETQTFPWSKNYEKHVVETNTKKKKMNRRRWIAWLWISEFVVRQYFSIVHYMRQFRIDALMHSTHILNGIFVHGTGKHVWRSWLQREITTEIKSKLLIYVILNWMRAIVLISVCIVLYASNTGHMQQLSMRTSSQHMNCGWQNH